MTTMEAYNFALDLRAEEERQKAAAAKAQGDERAHSMHLMCASMLGEMLKVLGRVQHEGERPDALGALAEAQNREEERQRARGDFDAADRARVKAQTIAWAQGVLAELEARHA